LFYFFWVGSDCILLCLPVRFRLDLIVLFDSVIVSGLQNFVFSCGYFGLDNSSFILHFYFCFPPRSPDSRFLAFRIVLLSSVGFGDLLLGWRWCFRLDLGP
jgi:hypothetical protein